MESYTRISSTMLRERWVAKWVTQIVTRWDMCLCVCWTRTKTGTVNITSLIPFLLWGQSSCQNDVRPVVFCTSALGRAGESVRRSLIGIMLTAGMKCDWRLQFLEKQPTGSWWRSSVVLQCQQQNPQMLLQGNERFVFCSGVCLTFLFLCDGWTILLNRNVVLPNCL